MNPVFHIITPVTRIFNLERIAHGLRATGDYDTHWHISFDHRLLGVGESGHAVRNRIIDTIPVCSENWIFMLDDDTLPHPDLSEVIAEDRSGCVRATLGREGGRAVEYLEIDGVIPDEAAAALEGCILEHLESCGAAPLADLGQYADPQIRHSHPLALTQLLLVYHLLRAKQHEEVEA